MIWVICVLLATQRGAINSSKSALPMTVVSTRVSHGLFFQLNGNWKGKEASSPALRGCRTQMMLSLKTVHPQHSHGFTERDHCGPVRRSGFAHGPKKGQSQNKNADTPAAWPVFFPSTAEIGKVFLQRARQQMFYALWA